MEILVTGASGFIGQHLARALAAQGHQVRVLLRSSHIETCFNGATKPFLGDLTHEESLRPAVEGVDLVYHLAAVRERWGLSYKTCYDINVEGTRYLLDAAAEQRARFVYCSSVGVLGYPGTLDVDESYPYCTKESKYPYHHTKALAEQLTREYAQRGWLRAVVVRPLITYGPGDAFGVVTRLLVLLARGHFVPVGDGRNHVHLAYITDTVRGIILAGESEQADGQVYILPGTRPITVRELIAQACALLKQSVPRCHLPRLPSQTVTRLFKLMCAVQGQFGLQIWDNEPFLSRDKFDALMANQGFSGRRAAQDLGYRPAMDYADGLRLTVAWARQSHFLP